MTRAVTLSIGIVGALLQGLPFQQMAVDTVQTFGVWRSLVARLVRDEEVAGSNPVTPTIRFFT